MEEFMKLTNKKDGTEIRIRPENVDEWWGCESSGTYITSKIKDRFYPIVSESPEEVTAEYKRAQGIKETR